MKSRQKIIGGLLVLFSLLCMHSFSGTHLSPSMETTTLYTAEDVPADWEIPWNPTFGYDAWVRYIHCEGYLEVEVRLRSPSGSEPNSVVVSLNGTNNHTMKARHMLTTGSQQSTNITTERWYFAYLTDIPSAEYNASFIVQNETSTWSTEVLRTAYVQEPLEFSNTRTKIGHNEFLFTTKVTELRICAEVDSPPIFSMYEHNNASNVIIDGEPGELQEDGSYTYQHAFSEEDDKVYQPYWTWHIPELNYTKNSTHGGWGNRLLTSPTHIVESWVFMSDILYRFEEEAFFIQYWTYYRDHGNNAPQRVWFDVNGTEHDVSVNALYEDVYGIMHRCDGPDWVCGESLKPIELELDYSTRYNITVFWDNGTAESPDIQEGENYNFWTPHPLAEPAVEIETSFEEQILEANITITSEIEDFTVSDVKMRYVAPTIAFSSRTESASEHDDETFTDGRTYSIVLNLTDEELFGEIEYYLSFEYYNSSDQSFYREHLYQSEIYTNILGEEQEIGVYGFNTGQWYEFNHTTFETDCCGNEEITTHIQQRWQIENVERRLGFDYITYQYEILDYDGCVEEWFSYLQWQVIEDEHKQEYITDPFYQEPSAFRSFLDPTRISSYNNLFFIPVGAEELLLEDYNTHSVDNSVWEFDAITNTLQYVWNYDDHAELLIEIQIDSRTGIIERHERTWRVGNYSEGMTLICVSDLSTFWEQYYLYFLIGGIIGILGIFVWISFKTTWGRENILCRIHKDATYCNSK